MKHKHKARSHTHTQTPLKARKRRLNASSDKFSAAVANKQTVKRFLFFRYIVLLCI